MNEELEKIIDHINDPNVKTPLDQITVITDDMVKKILSEDIITADRESLIKMLALSTLLFVATEKHLQENQKTINKMASLLEEFISME